MNKKGDLLKVHDMCRNPNCKCQKQIIFTPRQFLIRGKCFKYDRQKNLKGTKTAWDKFLKPAVNVDAPLIDMAVSAKTKNPEVGQATTIILQNISRGKTFN